MIRRRVYTATVSLCFVGFVLGGCGSIDRFYHPNPRHDVALVQHLDMAGGAAGSVTAEYYLEEIALGPSGPLRSSTRLGGVGSPRDLPIVWSGPYTVNVCDLRYDNSALRSVVLRSGATVIITTECEPPPPSLEEQQEALKAAKIDARVVMPPGAMAKEQYDRNYVLTDIRTTEDTPFFTTSNDFNLVTAQRLWVGVFVRPTAGAGSTRPGMRVMKGPNYMPLFFHGGCDVVNVVADPGSGRTISSWCNMDDRGVYEGAPVPIASYHEPQSPFR